MVGFAYLEGRVTVSKEALIAFDNRLHADKALQNQIRALKRVDTDGLVRIGAEAGFIFTATELIEMIYAAQEAAELSNEQLERVSGGAQVDFKPISLPAIQSFLSNVGMY